ncbi:G2 and S phase-expressed protein 1 isoform X2 [Myotis daubentonii]|uniref:G2 and S phase-expressed protein 1 isoform X2 n=1 Tax=Myotis daubentonii TaxID=98922 RepID=UPI002872F4A6|nr:G2 and S phase-expressed protein 1 isoform X2 [Myotis daubentonii]
MLRRDFGNRSPQHTCRTTSGSVAAARVSRPGSDAQPPPWRSAVPGAGHRLAGSSGMEGGGMEGGGSGGPPASQAGGAETEVPRKDARPKVTVTLPPDVLLLADEKFDFDLSLSSLSANEDDEVFFGPVGHKERCVAASLELGHPGPSPPQPPSSVSESPFRWSPLAGEKFVEVYKEARLLALQIESSSRSAAAPAPAGPEDAGSQGVERFIQESRLKMLLFEREKETQKSPNSLKRETYCLLDSPASGPQLPGSQPTSGVGPAGAQGPPRSSRPLPVEPSPARPPHLAVPQKKVASRLPPPRASSARGGSLPVAAEKPPKEKPASPSRMKIPHEKEPHGDKARAARDATTLPASRSHLVQGKRSLPAPNKLGLKKTQLRPPGGAGGPARQPCARGSVPGGSASLGASPAAGRAKSSERPSVSAARARPPDPRQLGRARAPAVRPVAELPAAPTALAVMQPQTPEQGGGRLSPRPSLSRSQLRCPGSARRASFLISQTKAPPTPTSQFKIPAFPPGDSTTPRFSGARRLQSCTSVGRVAHSTPAPRPSGPARTPASTTRASGLPTPAGRRLSGLPLVTPSTVPRTLASPLCVSTRQLSSEPRRMSAGRAAPGNGGSQAVAPGSDVSSDGSLSPAVPQALSFSPEKSEAAVSESAAAERALDAAQPPEEAAPREAVLVDVPLGQRVTPSTGRPLGDPPLIDLSLTPEAPVASGPGSRPLLDLLANTPDTDRKATAKPLPGVGQLIDLCSPLIQLSPEANKENLDSPLLRF